MIFHLSKFQVPCSIESIITFLMTPTDLAEYNNTRSKGNRNPAHFFFAFRSYLLDRSSSHTELPIPQMTARQ